MPNPQDRTRRRRRRIISTARVESPLYHPLNAGQKIIWNSKAKIVAAISGHFGGKSHLGAYWLLDQVRKSWRRNMAEDFIVCGPTYNNLQNSAIPKLRSLFALHGLPWEYDQHKKIGFRSSNKEYWMPGGSIIYFRSADRPGSMQGTHARAFWMDEVVDTTYYVYETLRGRIAGLGGRGLITSTPYDRGWMYEHIYKRWLALGGKDADPNGPVCVAQWRSIDNPSFPKNEWEDMKATMPEWRFRMLYEGEFERPMGLVYDCFQPHHWIEPFEIPENWPRILGVDFGFKDPMAAIWIAKAPNGKYFAYDEFYQSGWMRYGDDVEARKKGKMSMPREMMDEIIDRCEVRHEHLQGVYCDSSNAEMTDYAKEQFLDRLGFRHCYGAAKGPGSIMSGVDANYVLVKRNDFYAFNTLHNFQDETERYSYETDKVTGEVKDKVNPVDSFNHLLDAWRYAMAGSPDEKHNSFGYGSLDGLPGWHFNRAGIITRDYT